MIQKKVLFDYCERYVDERIKLTTQAMNAAQEAANSETKGSAGDKHETGRAMMHLEKEQHGRQLAEHLKLRKVLAQMNPQEKHLRARLGSVVFTDTGIYFLAIPIGKVDIEGKTFFIISPVSPIGKLLMNSQKGSELNLNGRKIIVESVI